MTLIRQLFSLQELDLSLDLIGSQAAQAEQELESRLYLGALEASIEAAKQELEGNQSQHRQQRLEVETLRERCNHLDAILYSGVSSNPRELESLEQEATNTRVRLERMDDQLVELGLRIEQSGQEIQGMESQLSDTQSAWELRQAELTEQVNKLTAEREDLSSRRAELAATLDATELQRYERLRASKGGRAIAKVERGLCQVCNMTLPSQHLQRVRSGRQTVLCNSCGRMLLPG
jgi:predicted  nucleic acid-binding Zn-ribbon protein